MQGEPDHGTSSLPMLLCVLPASAGRTNFLFMDCCWYFVWTLRKATWRFEQDKLEHDRNFTALSAFINARGLFDLRMT